MLAHGTAPGYSGRVPEEVVSPYYPNHPLNVSLAGPPTAVVVVDAAGSPVWWNTAASELCGTPPWPAGGLPPDLVDLARASALGSAPAGRAVLARPDGNELALEVNVQKLADGGAVIILRDRAVEGREIALRDAVYQIAKAAAETTDLIDLFRDIHRIIAGLIYAPNLYFSLYDEEAEAISFPYFVDPNRFTPTPNWRPLEHGLTEYLIRTGKPLLLDEAGMHRMAETGEITPPTVTCTSWIGVPLRTGDSTVGTVALLSYDPARMYTVDDQAILEFVSRQAAMAIHRRMADDHRARLEARLRQADKMESIGRLAGGVAHDLNNLLVPILGYAELIGERWNDEELREMAGRIRESAEKARNLVDQLLAFSRRRTIRPTSLDLRAVLLEIGAVFHRKIRAEITLKVEAGPTSLLASADRAQIEQVLLNLALNAQEAMSGPGTIGLSLEPVAVDRRSGLALEPGSYVLIRVTDTGTGMDEHTRRSLFEPFFTTKQLGRGAGLGLSTSYGVVRQHGGDIEVESSPGHGSEFRVYLPRILAEGEAPDPQVAAAEGEAETLLLVQESPGVRSLASAILSRAGYSVLPAAGAAECLERSRARVGPIGLVITDGRLPGTTGPELLEKLREERPGIRVLYTLQTAVGDGEPEASNLVPCVGKPFSPAALRRAVRAALDAEDR